MNPANRSLRAPGADRPLSLLYVPGPDHVGAASEDALGALILDRLEAAGRPRAEVQLRFLRYDSLFGAGPTPAQTARGLELLDRGAAELAIAPSPLLPGISLLDLGDEVHCTAGMVMQWIEDAALRGRLVRRLAAAIRNSGATVVLAHSLGSLIAYDLLRRAVVAGGAALAAVDGLWLVGLGSQLANPVLVSRVWGAPPPPLRDPAGRGVASWIQLYNPHDRVFTCPMVTRDAARGDLLTAFPDDPRAVTFALNHAPAGYLDHPLARQRLWPALAAIGGAAAKRMVPGTRRRRQPHRRALLVGINAYPDAGMRLDGCVNDVFLVSHHLQRSGFAAAEIRLLVDERATCAAIVERLQWLIEDADDGDELLFFYSGHGAQIPAYGADDEPDHRVETLVPVDFSWDDERTHFTDKQFRRFYAGLPFGQHSEGAHLTAVFDCCHAAGMTRGAGRVRGINPPPDIRHRMLRWDEAAGGWSARGYMADAGAKRAFSDAGGGAERTQLGLGVSADMRLDDRRTTQRQRRLYGHAGPYMPLLLYAAREAELASEYLHGAESYGAFTFALVEQLARHGAASFAAAIDRAEASLRARQFSQRPELVGPRVLRERECPWSVGAKKRR